MRSTLRRPSAEYRRRTAFVDHRAHDPRRNLDGLRTRLEKARRSAGEALERPAGGDWMQCYGEGTSPGGVKARRLLGIHPGRLNLCNEK
jgi:hypothetical protein